MAPTCKRDLLTRVKGDKVIILIINLSMDNPNGSVTYIDKRKKIERNRRILLKERGKEREIVCYGIQVCLPQVDTVHFNNRKVLY